MQKTQIKLIHVQNPDRCRALLVTFQTIIQKKVDKISFWIPKESQGVFEVSNQLPQLSICLKMGEKSIESTINNDKEQIFSLNS